MDVPSSSADVDLQDRFNRQVEEVTSKLDEKLEYIKSIPNDGSITTVEEIIAYLRG